MAEFGGLTTPIDRASKLLFKMIKTNTVIDEWLEEAEQRGIERGIEEGRQEGELAAERRMLLLLLERRFGTVPVRLVLRINELSVDELSRLFELALDASGMEEVEEAVKGMALRQGSGQAG